MVANTRVLLNNQRCMNFTAHCVESVQEWASATLQVRRVSTQHRRQHDDGNDDNDDDGHHHN